jgi:dUTP pyrophosphatase
MKGLQFYKVSFNQFKKDCLACNISHRYTHAELKEIYDNIKLPKRATSGSAGYDFYSPFPFQLLKDGGVLIPTGIRARMPKDVVLMIVPRSGMGFKYRIQLDNTVGIIDSDYYGANNEGHIMAKITCDSKTPCRKKVAVGDAFAQGIFMYYLVTDDDEALAKRVGGLGSTDE